MLPYGVDKTHYSGTLNVLAFARFGPLGRFSTQGYDSSFLYSIFS